MGFICPTYKGSRNRALYKAYNRQYSNIIGLIHSTYVNPELYVKCRPITVALTAGQR